MPVDIVAIVQSVVGELSTTPLFAHGPESYQNYITDQTDLSNGIAYLDEPITSDDRAEAGGAYTEKFPLKMFFGVPVPPSQIFDFAAHHAAAISQRDVRFEFINRLKLREEIDLISDIKTVELINEFDSNVSGVALYFTCTCTSADSTCVDE